MSCSRITRRCAFVATLVLSCGCDGKDIEHAMEAGAGGAAGGLEKGASSARDAGQGGQSCWSNDLPIAFAPDMYSAYIEGSNRIFMLPVLAQGAEGLTARWSASDPTMVKIEPSYQGGMLLTMQRAGEVTITANANGRCGTSTLHITSATEEQWQAGIARYNNMYPLPKITADAGVPVDLTNVVVDPPGMPPACTNCHGVTATSEVFRTITFTPNQTGGYSDQQLVDIFTKGVVPMDGYFSGSAAPASAWSVLHSWSDISAEQAQAIVVYLRSLNPRASSQPDNDPGFVRPFQRIKSGTADGGALGSDAGTSDAGSDARPR